jgi:hypothetical protein
MAGVGYPSSAKKADARLFANRGDGVITCLAIAGSVVDRLTPKQTRVVHCAEDASSSKNRSRLVRN